MILKGQYGQIFDSELFPQPCGPHADDSITFYHSLIDALDPKMYPAKVRYLPGNLLLFDFTDNEMHYFPHFN